MNKNISEKRRATIIERAKTRSRRNQAALKRHIGPSKARRLEARRIAREAAEKARKPSKRAPKLTAEQERRQKLVELVNSVDLNKMPVRELHALAKHLGMKGYTLHRKGELIKRIKAAVS